MKIYRIRTAINYYQYLEPEDGGTVEDTNILSRCQPLTQPLTQAVISKRPKLPSPDFWNFAPYSTLAMPQASVDKVRHFLTDSGELLLVPYKTETFSVLNVLSCVNYRVFSENVPGHLHQECIEGKIPTTIFRDIDRVYMYVAERSGDSATEFKAFVENAGMTGLKFYQVWDSEF